MKSKKIIFLMFIITVLIIIMILGIVLKIFGIENLNNKSVKIISAESNNIKNEHIENKNLNEISSEQHIQENTTGVILGNNLMNTVVSRSNINRKKDDTIHVNLNQTFQEDYEEIITYTKLEDVKISFNMDVSKTTGLSKDDFVILVKNMKSDKTGILEKNAAWIWECCQKYNVNEIFVFGICGIESAWCSAPQHQRTHNYCSMMKAGKLISYSSDEAGFEAMIKLLGQKYLSPKGGLYNGATITGVGTKFCNTTTWPPKVYKCMKQVLNCN